MSTTTAELAPFTLIRAKDGSVLSFRHRALAGADGNHIGAGQSSAAVIALIQDRTWEIVADPDVKPSIRTCLECGCTEEFACQGGCTWAAESLCSSCVLGPFPFRSREDVEAEISSVYGQSRENHESAVVELARIQCELLLDIRDALVMPQQDAARGLLESMRGAETGRLVVAGAAPYDSLVRFT